MSKINGYFLDSYSENVLNKVEMHSFLRICLFTVISSVHKQSGFHSQRGRQPHLEDVCLLRNPRSCLMIFVPQEMYFLKLFILCTTMMLSQRIMYIIL